MKIVYVTQRLPFGEGETFVVPEVDALLAAGHEVMIVPRTSEDPVVHDDVGALLARTRRLPRRGPDRSPPWSGACVRPATHAGRVLAAAAYPAPPPGDRQHHGDRAGHLGGTGRARSWGADHIHAHWAHLTATLAMAASTVSGIPWSFTAHRYDVVLNNLLDDKLRSARFGRFIARKMLAVARPLVAADAIAARRGAAHGRPRCRRRPTGQPARGDAGPALPRRGSSP